jgi:hypothetical protein
LAGNGSVDDACQDAINFHKKPTNVSPMFANSTDIRTEKAEIKN